MYWPQQLLPAGSKPLRVQVLNSLYGEKQAAYIWNETLNTIMTGMNFIRLTSDPCVYKFRDEDGRYLYVAVHVDDMLIVAETQRLAQSFVTDFQRKVRKFTVMNDFSKYLGIEVAQSNSSSCQIKQSAYIEDMMKTFLGDWDPSSENASLYTAPISPKHINILLQLTRRQRENNSRTAEDDDENEDSSSDNGLLPSQRTEGNVSFLPLVGKLRHLIDTTRPDLLATVSILSSLQHYYPHYLDPIIWINLLKYIYYTRDQHIRVNTAITTTTFQLFAFSDASYVTDSDSKSRLGACFYLSKSSGAICSYSRKDTTISHSSTEAEIKAIDMSIRQVIYLREFLRELGYEQRKPTVIFVDNKSAIQLCESFKTNHLVRHINMRINYIRECINNRIIELHFIPTNYNVADILTKLLLPQSYNKLQKWLLEGFNDNDMQSIYLARTVTVHKQGIGSDITIESILPNALRSSVAGQHDSL
jgi:hypothetical protein